jgi:hypothetical protein
MGATLARHPDVVMIVEVFPGGLRGAGASARALMEALADLGLGGWEFGRHRVLPIGAPWTYDLMTGGMTDVIVSRNAERLRDLVSRWRGIPVPHAR